MLTELVYCSVLPQHTNHPLTDRTWRRPLIDVKVERSAEVTSDYHLLIALIQLKLRISNKNQIVFFYPVSS